MIQVQLRPRGSHRHLVPVIILYLFVVAFCDVKKLTGEMNWLIGAGGLLLSVVIGIVAFYWMMPFLYMMNLKESWFGKNFFSLSIPSTKLRRAIVATGHCLTYFGFICRICMIFGLEAAFLLSLLAASIGRSLDSNHLPWWMPYLLLPLLILITTVHTLIERKNLGMAGFSIVTDPKTDCL
ncbi:MAG: hypothetical protein JXB10_06450 [Pirellulales bacterium]|nr:hypothetical protein [Pirellulales bacterium]